MLQNNQLKTTIVIIIIIQNSKAGRQARSAKTKSFIKWQKDAVEGTS